MNITIFGTTGGTGQELLKQAIQKGYRVTVFVRNPAKLDIRNINVIRGDVKNRLGVQKAIKDAQVVISALGVRPGQKPVCAIGVKNIIEAMQMYHVKRLIVVSAYGAGRPRAGMYVAILRLMIPRHIRDKEHMEQIIKQSHLDWTIVRPTVLANGEKVGKITHGANFSPRGLFPSISRADVARFMLKQIETSDYVRKTVTITEK